jgi:DNA-directed RNA polymerase specialized sigma24 family protein
MEFCALKGLRDMSRNATSFDTPLLIRNSTGGDDNALEGSDDRYGGTLVCAPTGSIQLSWIDTTDFDGEEVANTALLKLCEAWDRAIFDGILDGGGLGALTENAPTAELQGGQGSVPGDRTQETDPCVATRPAEISSLGSTDLEMIEAIRRLHDRCATFEDEMACDAFCKIQYPKILAIIRRRLICRPVADDLAQDVWYKALDYLAERQLDPPHGTLESWIARIANSAARSHARRHTEHQQQALTVELAAKRPDPDAEPSAKFGQMQRLDKMLAIIQELRASLPDLQRRMLFMR